MDKIFEQSIIEQESKIVYVKFPSIYLLLHIYGSPFYSATTQFQCPMAIGRDRGWSTLCRSCEFASQRRMLKMFPGPGYLSSEEGSLTLVFIGEFAYVRLTIYSDTAQSQYLVAIGRDTGLSTLCHDCRFAYQQRVLKGFPGSAYLSFKMG